MNNDISYSMYIDEGEKKDEQETYSMPSACPNDQFREINKRNIYSWVKDDAVTECYQCSVNFSLFNRRHHCRGCGRIFCNNCSSKRIELSKDIGSFPKSPESNLIIEFNTLNLLLKISENPLMPIAVLATVWYSTRDFLMLTAALMIMITFQVIVERLVKKEVSKLLFISWCLVIPFGAMTLLLRDPIFLQWKFSIVHWLLGSILLGSYLFKGPVALKSFFLSTGLKLQEVPDESWRNVTYFISIALLAVGTINLYFIYFADLAMWVNFKIFGVTILNILIISASFFYLFSKSPSSEKE